MTRFAGQKMEKAMSEGGTKGSFTAAASRAGKGVQEYANEVLAHKDEHSAKLVKKANFAKNAAGWRH
jgi:predicted secreted protein